MLLINKTFNEQGLSGLINNLEQTESLELGNLRLELFNRKDSVEYELLTLSNALNFSDGSTSALLSDHDMRIPIFYALNWPSREYYKIKRIDLFKIKKFTFEKPNINLIQSINLAYYVLKKGGSFPLIFNTANEVAVNFFLEKKIHFLDIINIIKKILSISKNYKINKIDDVYNIDKEIRILTTEYINNKWKY